MPLVSEQLPNLMGGVSQQAISMRQPSQGEAQVNAVSSLVDGNTKRPPLLHLGRISTSAFGKPYVHTINRDVSERYKVVMDGTTLRVFALSDGSEKTVAFPDGAAYLATATPRASLAAVTVADYTFVVNKEVTVAEAATQSPVQPYWGQVFVKALTYGLQAVVEVDGVARAEYTTSGASFYASKEGLSGERTAETLYSYLLGTPFTQRDNPDEWYYVPIWNLRDEDLRRPLEFTIPTTGGEDPQPVRDTPLYIDSDHKVQMTALPLADYSVERYGNLIHIERYDQQVFQFDVTDTEDGSYFTAVTPAMSAFTDLPKAGKDGYKVKIVGEEEDNDNDYWLKFVTTNAGETFGDGYWEETVAPGVGVAFDAATMPHILVRESDGTFTFKEAAWGERVAGDIETAPWPSFVGRTINDVYFDRRRLCFLTDDNMVASRAGAFFDFFPETVTTILDDGPIDVSTSSRQVSLLSQAVPYDGKILLFSDQAQFVIDTEDLLASKPPAIKPVSFFESLSVAKPVSSGTSVFFPAEKGERVSVREFVVRAAATDNLDAPDRTEHVPTYIPSGVFSMAVTALENMLFLLTEGAENEVYVYKYHSNAGQLLQASWSKWELEKEARVLSLSVINDVAYFMVEYPDGVYLMNMNLGSLQYDGAEPYNCRLDRRVTEASAVSLAYSAVTNETTFSIPYPKGSEGLVVVSRYGDGTSNRGVGSLARIIATSNGPNSTSLRVKGDWTATKFFVGVPYEHLYEFSEVTLRTQQPGGGMASLAAGRLQLSRMHVLYGKTGFFKAEVIPQQRTPFTYTFTGDVLGAQENILGVPSISSGSFAFRVNTRADRLRVVLRNSTHLPSTFTGAEWEGRYSRKTSRV